MVGSRLLLPGFPNRGLCLFVSVEGIVRSNSEQMDSARICLKFLQL